MAVRKRIDEWTSASEAESVIQESLETSCGSRFAYDQNFEIIEHHDHWREGLGWVGPNGGPDRRRQRHILKQVEPGFIPVDAAGDIVGNVVDAIAGTEGDVGFAPVSEEAEGLEETEAEIDAAAEGEGESAAAEDTVPDEVRDVVAALSRWWDDKRLWDKVRVAIKRSQYAGRGGLYLRVPANRLVNGALPTVGTLAEALELIEIETPVAHKAYRYTDPETTDECAISLVEREGKTVAQLWRLVRVRATPGTPSSNGAQAPATPTRALEAQPGEEGEWVVRYSELPAKTGEATPYPDLPLGRRLPLIELTDDVLLTEPIRRQQAQVNFAKTILNRLLQTGGFPQVVTTNAQPPSIWMRSKPTDAPPLETKIEGGVTWYRHRVAWEMGAGAVLELMGVDLGVAISGEPGQENRAVRQITTPSFERIAPVDPTYSTGAIDHALRILYGNCKQRHLAKTSTSEASGEAYEQDRAQFTTYIKNRGGKVARFLAELLESALAIAALIAPEAGVDDFLETYRAVVGLHTDTGPVAEGTQRLAVELYEKRLIARGTMQHRLGVDDTDAENAAIERDEPQRLTLSERRATIVRAWLNADAPLSGAVTESGLDADERERIYGDATPIPSPATPPPTTAEDGSNNPPPPPTPPSSGSPAVTEPEPQGAAR